MGIGIIIRRAKSGRAIPFVAKHMGTVSPLALFLRRCLCSSPDRQEQKRQNEEAASPVLCFAADRMRADELFGGYARYEKMSPAERRTA